VKGFFLKNSRPIYASILAALMVIGIAMVSSSIAFAQSINIIEASHVSGSLHVDGKLSEAAWRSAGRISDLTQQEPHPGESTPFHTEVLILSTKKSLWIGVRCFDPRPGKIRAHTMQRDGDMDGDDNIAFVLDTFGDGRRGYYFRVNAAGARADGLVMGPEHVSFDWDGTWVAKTSRTVNGWIAEIEIPAYILRFSPDLDRWGFNIERRVARKRTVLRWCGTSLDARLPDLRRAGVLEGVGEIKQGLGITIVPYGIARADREEYRYSHTCTGDIGGDISYNITSDLTAAITANTDFAETEVDNRRINLTRFPLFFPEKRAFFLEGSDIFGFGSGLGRDFIPFFSRRIGLYESEEVPIDVGGRVLGRIGSWNVAMLDVTTRETPLTRRTNLFAGRATCDIGDHLTIGTIATHGDPEGRRANWLGGLDALWQTSTFRGDKNLSVGGWFAESVSDSTGGNHHGYGFKLDYPNDLWDVSFIYREFGDRLNPALGFLPRPGTRWYILGGAFQPRPKSRRLDWARQFYFETFAHVITGLDGEVQSWRVFMAPLNVETESGEHFEFNIVPQFDSIDEPFEVVEGVTLPPGSYHFKRFRIEAESSDHRPLVAGSRVWFGGFYTGSLIQWETELDLTTFASHLHLGITLENDFGYLPEGDFVQRVMELKMVYAFNPDMNISNYLQYDTESDDIGLNARFRWTIRPGTDLFVVWNKGWIRDEESSALFPFRPVENHVAVKLKIMLNA